MLWYCRIIRFRYTGDVNDEASLKAAVEGTDGGPRNTSYTKLVAWVTDELRALADLEEMVNATATSDEHSAFLMELSSFLKELSALRIFGLVKVTSFWELFLMEGVLPFICKDNLNCSDLLETYWNFMLYCNSHGSNLYTVQLKAKKINLKWELLLLIYIMS